jgi:hypothetical protein
MDGKEVMPQQDTNICELFSFLNWQGIGLVRYLYWIGAWVIGFLNFGCLITGLATGHPAWMIGVFIVIPLLFIFEILILRIFCEIAVVILLLPHILRKNNFGSGEHGDVTVIEDPNDDGDMDCSVHRDLI